MHEPIAPEAAAELAEFVVRFERDLAALTPVHLAPPEETRASRREGVGPYAAPVFDPGAEWVDADGVRLRVLRPAGEARGVYLHVHGGGWVLGAADLQDALLRRFADETGLVAASVEYRLAPEHPYPAGPDDCERAALWLVEHGEQELGAPPRLAIGGESAGAHLAVVTLLRLRDRHGLAPFERANLGFGVYDLAHTPSSRAWGDRYLSISTPIMHWFADCFLPRMPLEERRVADVSPLYADLAGLPPALFTVGTQDPLLDDTLFMHARWRAAGNDARLLVYEGAPHGFTAFPLAVARAALAAQLSFLAGGTSDPAPNVAP